MQDAVIRNIEIIGEAARRISTGSADFARDHPELRLELAYRMRNAVAHGYDSVNPLIVWNTVATDLPALARQIEALKSK